MQRLIVLFVITLLLATGLPVYAQGGDTHTIAFDGFSFTYDATLGTEVNISQVAGQPVDRQGPGSPEPPYTEFIVSAPEPGVDELTPYLTDAPFAVRVYRVADVAAYPYSQQQADQLAALLNTRPDLATYMRPEEIAKQNWLPFLPVFPATQVIRARAHYVDLPTLSGVAFLTTYRQDASPFRGNEFFYTFQGLSADGQYYVSAVMGVDTMLFPTETPAGFDYNAWVQTMSTYNAESQAALNNAASTDFSPALTVADAVFANFAFLP